MFSQTSILVYGRDPQLLATRCWVLEGAGYRVSTVTDLSGLAQLVWNQQINLIILCHTLSLEECDSALALAHARCPQVRSLAITAGPCECRNEFSNQVVDAMEGPVKLLDTLRDLVASESDIHFP